MKGKMILTARLNMKQGGNEMQQYKYKTKE